MLFRHWFVGIAVACGMAAGSAHAGGWNPQAQAAQLEDAQQTIAAFKASDPGMQVFFDKAHGYAVFPTIGKGGFVFAGAYGRGLVFEKGVPIGRTAVHQITFGAQIGGQNFSEILFFKDKAALDRFKTEQSELSAQASAVVARDGAAAQTSYDNRGVAVFVYVKGGAMVEASVGGQGFKYEPGLED